MGGAALGNGGAGVYLFVASSGVEEDTLIGSATDAAAAKVIAYNAGAGVRMAGSAVKHNSIRENSIHDNGGSGISLESTANQGITAPSIAGISPLYGTACPSCAVDIYSDSADEGRIFEGTVTADGSGQWSYPSSVSGPNVTATNTDAANNTSEFSAPVSVVQQKPDGRIRKGHGHFIGNNVYNLTGVNQTKTGSTARGNTITFGISTQNDSTASGAFTLKATGTATNGVQREVLPRHHRHHRGDRCRDLHHARAGSRCQLPDHGQAEGRVDRHRRLERHPPRDHYLGKRRHQAGRGQVHRQAELARAE